MSNIEDVTNSTKDWEDFWYNEDKDLKPKSKPNDYFQSTNPQGCKDHGSSLLSHS